MPSKDSQISFKDEELEGTFGEEVGVGRQLADQHVCSGGGFKSKEVREGSRGDGM